MSDCLTWHGLRNLKLANDRKENRIKGFDAPVTCKRNCLRCDKSFDSIGISNRICTKCAEVNRGPDVGGVPEIWQQVPPYPLGAIGASKRGKKKSGNARRLINRGKIR